MKFYNKVPILLFCFVCRYLYFNMLLYKQIVLLNR